MSQSQLAAAVVVLLPCDPSYRGGALHRAWENARMQVIIHVMSRKRSENLLHVTEILLGYIGND